MQAVQLDLPALAGCIPVDLFGGCLMPAIEPAPYTITLSGYAFYWLKLLSPEEVMSRSDHPLEIMDRPELPAKDRIRGQRPSG
jgi:maltose alpha-D-glucosyltransferase/alpha-amylase